MKMNIRKKVLIVLTLSLLAAAFTVPAVNAKTSEYDAIVKHLKTKYRAKKVYIPFMTLARLAVKVVRPAGVKSFNATFFQDLKFSSETLDKEMQEALKNSFSTDWTSILRVRSRDGQQVYMYMRDAGNDVRLTMVAIDKEQAMVVRATINGDKLAEFINDPKIFGISLNDDNSQSKALPKAAENDPVNETKEH